MQAFLAWPDSLDLAKLCSLESLAKLQFYWYSVCCLAKRWGSAASYMAPFSFSVHAQGRFCLMFMNLCSWLSVNIVSAHVHVARDSTICRKSLRGRLLGMDHCWWIRPLGMDHCWWVRLLGVGSLLVGQASGNEPLFVDQPSGDGPLLVDCWFSRHKALGSMTSLSLGSRSGRVRNSGHL